MFFELVIIAMLSGKPNNEPEKTTSFNMNLYRTEEECREMGTRIYNFMQNYLREKKFIRTDEGEYILQVKNWYCQRKDPPREEYFDNPPLPPDVPPNM